LIEAIGALPPDPFYFRRRSAAKARNWPHKKREKPPDEPKIQSATAEQRRAAKRVKAKQAAL
jgi:hypothetical protein